MVGRKRVTRKPWLSDEAYAIIKKKSEARKKGNNKVRNQLKRSFDKRALQDKETFYNNIADEAEAGIVHNDLKTTYRAIKILSGPGKFRSCDVPINDSAGFPCKSEDSILERWAEHYENALNHPSPPHWQELSDTADRTSPDSNVKEDPPTLTEMKTAIQKLRNGRAAGSDNLPAELLKCAIDPVSKALHNLFHRVWQSGRVPSEWKDGIVVSLYKGKGPRSECSSYRPITLLSVPGKVFAHVLLARLQPLLHNKRRIGLAASTMKNLSRVWNQKKLSSKTKFRIYSTCVLPVLLYSSETWTLPQSSWDKLQAFHMRCQRRILRIKWNDYVSNIKVGERSGLQDLHTIVRKRRLGLFGHVARLSSNTPANQALAICCLVRDGTRPANGWKRPRGRPHTTWTHRIHHDTGIPATEALQLACDRRLWRTIATADSMD